MSRLPWTLKLKSSTSRSSRVTRLSPHPGGPRDDVARLEFGHEPLAFCDERALGVAVWTSGAPCKSPGAGTVEHGRAG